MIKKLLFPLVFGVVLAGYSTFALLDTFVVEQPMQDVSFDSHFFDDFPWNDPRIFKTPIGKNKIKDYCSLVFQCNNPEMDAYVMEALKASKVDSASYFAFFDGLEKVLGDHGSPYRVERLYIPMLQDMLSFPKLPALRERHCQYELRVINQNNVGDVVPNFNFVTNTGGSSTDGGF